jgi:hypothetical protein
MLAAMEEDGLDPERFTRLVELASPLTAAIPGVDANGRALVVYMGTTPPHGNTSVAREHYRTS